MTELENLKVGDAVCLPQYRGFSPSMVGLVKGEVERVTKTQITAFGGRRFLIRTGKEVGKTESRFHVPTRIKRLTPEIEQEHKEAVRISRAIRECRNAASILERATGDDALKYTATLSDELKGGEA